MSFEFPPMDLLSYHNGNSRFEDKEYVKELAQSVVGIFKSFKVDVVISDIDMSPFAACFDMVPDSGTSVKVIKSLRPELELYLGAPVEIVSIGEKAFTIKIAVKNLDRPLIGLREILESGSFKNSDYKIPVAVGMDVLGKPFIFDMAETPHLLVAGATGSGKSTFLNDMILSIIYSRSPKDVQLILADPKAVEFGPYVGIPHLVFPPVLSSEAAYNIFGWAEDEMMKRYTKFSEVGVKEIDSYNEKVSEGEKIPRIVIIIDEYMEMMYQAPKELEDIIIRLSRLARASGIHLVLSTQRPTAKVVTPAIKANIPCRASFTVVDWRESKVILDRTGAERLLGGGDMQYSISESTQSIHAQAAYVSYSEIDAVINWYRKQN